MNDIDYAAANRASTARRLADRREFIMPDRPADRSRNGRRAPRSVRHRAYR